MVSDIIVETFIPSDKGVTVPGFNMHNSVFVLIYTLGLMLCYVILCYVML